MLRLTGVTRRFRGMDRPALDKLDLDVARGEIVALAGPSGSGKTTALRIIAGFEDPDEGTVELNGRVVGSPRVSVPPERRSVGVVFQDYALFPHMTVAENIGFGLSKRRAVARERRERAAELLTYAGIPELIDRYPHECSGGQQQRVALARALAPGPELILLDEPFSNLDHTCTHRMLAETRDLLVGAGTTAIVVTHDRYEAFTLADRIAFIDEGRLMQVGTAEELYGQPMSRASAEFAGSASFVALGEDGVHLRSLGAVPDDVAIVRENGDTALAVVRPHQIRLEPRAGGEGNARVVDTRMLGAVVAVRLAVEGADEPILVHVPGPVSGLRPGERVEARWATTPSGTRH